MLREGELLFFEEGGDWQVAHAPADDSTQAHMDNTNWTCRVVKTSDMKLGDR